MICDICRVLIPLGLSEKEEIKYHIPAYHVANAYHKSKLGVMCIADNKLWPCPTIIEFGRN